MKKHEPLNDARGGRTLPRATVNMKTAAIDEIIEILPKDRTKYFYFKDKYAVDLLRLVVDDTLVSELKASRFSGLLRKPVIRQRLAKIGSSRIRKSDLEDLWSDTVEPFILTVGRWGEDSHRHRSYFQTTSNDANLVLQLNFSNCHNGPFRKLIGQGRERQFEYRDHPIAREPYRTLAWARLDLDLENSEALIEEVQTDWIRYGLNRLRCLERIGRSDWDRSQRLEHRYLSEVMLPYERLWKEAILSAALGFIAKEIGLDRVFYHSFHSGCALKRMMDWQPPRSLYEELPRKFCFEKQARCPRFLERRMRRAKWTPEFYVLELKDAI